MKGFLITFGLVLALQFFVISGVTFAAEETTTGGLVQLSGCSGPDCSACNAVDMLNGFIKWLIGIMFVLCGALLAVAGVRLVTSGGNSHTLDEAKGMLTNAIIGMIIILSAWLIIDTVMRGLVGSDGKLATDGDVSGWLFWSEVQCQVILAPKYDKDNTLQLSYEGETQEMLLSSCMASGLTPAELTAMGCTFSACTTTACLTSCMNIVKGTAVGKTDNGDYCAVSTPPTGGTVPVVPRSGMLSLRDAGLVVASWNGIDGPGRTDLANPVAVSAALAMQNAGKSQYGRQPFQITAAYTEGVGHSAGSQHYTGLAIDFQPINGLSYEQVAQLARAAGFHYVLIESATRHVHADMR